MEACKEPMPFAVLACAYTVCRAFEFRVPFDSGDDSSSPGGFGAKRSSPPSLTSIGLCALGAVTPGLVANEVLPERVARRSESIAEARAMRDVNVDMTVPDGDMVVPGDVIDCEKVAEGGPVLVADM